MLGFIRFLLPLLLNALYSQGDNGLVTTVLLTRIIACTSAAFPRISLK